MPDIVDMLQQNPEMAQSLDQPTQPATATTLIPRTDAQQSRMNDVEDTIGQMPSFLRARHARTADALSDPDLESSMESHHQAVADANAFHHQTSQELAYSLAAHTLHDTAGYYQRVHGISVTDPDHDEKMIAAAQDFPHAKPDAELMRPHYEGRKAYLDANSAAEQLRQEKSLTDEVGKGNLRMEDLANPAYRDPSGGLNYTALRLLGAARQSGQLPGGQPKLTPEEEVEWKAAHVDPNYKKNILGATDNPADPKYDPAAATRKALFWSANRKLSPAAQPTASALPDANKIFGGQ